MDHNCGLEPTGEFVHFDQYGEYWIGVDGERMSVGPINFCPYCGVKLEADEQEVRALRERIEAQEKAKKEKERSAFREVADILKNLPSREGEK